MLRRSARTRLRGAIFSWTLQRLSMNPRTVRLMHCSSRRMPGFALSIQTTTAAKITSAWPAKEKTSRELARSYTNQVVMIRLHVFDCLTFLIVLLMIDSPFQ